MANNVLKQISVNLGVTGYDDSSLLIGIADYYGVNTTISNNLMGDILTAVGGDPAISRNYIQDIVIELGGPSTSNNWIEEWLAVSAGPVFSDDRITEASDSRYTEDGIAERVTEII